MARPDLAEKDILNPSEAIEYFVLTTRALSTPPQTVSPIIPALGRQRQADF